jgi:hypothetical protein
VEQVVPRAPSPQGFRAARFPALWPLTCAQLIAGSPGFTMQRKTAC